MGQAAHSWRDHIWAAPPPCGVVWLPGGAEGQAQGVGGLFARVGSPFSEPRDEYVHFSKTYL